MLLAAEFGTGQVFWSILWLTLFFIWIWLLILVFADIFRSDDMSGWIKAIWIIFVIILPYLGVLVYLIARGGKMQKRAMEDAQQRDAAMRAYVRDAAGTSPVNSAEELSKLADLRDRGVIDEAEFQRAKAKILG
jgi:hypothetical protein